MADQEAYAFLADPESGAFYRECGKAYRPDLRLARKIIDTHCHIYPDGIAPKAIKAIDFFYEGLPAKPSDGTTGTLIKKGDAEGIDCFVVHSVATTAAQVSHINAYVAGCVEEQNGRFIGLGTLFPGSENTGKDFEELLTLGLKGVKIHPDIQRFEVDSPWAMGVFEMCEDKGVPICVHTGDFRYDYSNPQRVARVLQRFPGLKLIGAHFGGWSVWDEAVNTLMDFPNLTVDTSSSFFWLKGERAREIIRLFGSGRVMFGSDYPMWPRTNELEYLRRLGLTQEEYDDICFGTASRLFGLTI